MIFPAAGYLKKYHKDDTYLVQHFMTLTVMMMTLMILIIMTKMKMAMI